MALRREKTYSKQTKFISDKENIEDPFDELFLSPLKQDVKFKPLSFWNNGSIDKTGVPESFRRRNLGLFDDVPSPCRKSIFNDAPLPLPLKNTLINANESKDFIEETFIQCAPQLDENHKLIKKKEESYTETLNSNICEEVTTLTSMLSEMEILKEGGVDSELEKTYFNCSDCDETFKTAKDISEISNLMFLEMCPNITKRKKPMTINQNSTQNFDLIEMYSNEKKKIEENYEEKNKSRTSSLLDGFSTFINPVFESTRIQDDSLKFPEQFILTEDSKIFREPPKNFKNCIALKSGKKWRRSMSVLKNVCSNCTVANESENPKLKGRNFESFVQEIMQMQNDISDCSLTSGSVSLSEKTLTPINDEYFLKSNLLASQAFMNEDETSFKDCQSKDDFNSESFFLERTLMSHTVKFIEPKVASTKPTAFTSALGLDCDSFLVEDDNNDKNTVEGEISVSVSPKDFVLAQCGQSEVLPFEEYFNEKTLKNCKKIGEGVYGEVFMCNSDTVIKIIPIEGSEKVNGEPQKTFREILSEIVIASKLSNLRNGKSNRTSGFSEMKRCWCVVGKYPQYLLDLWNEYDQMGRGSENDSPIIFKTDQLYIILELVNGGKDLESYVFKSSEQSFSVFVQAAFSLAAAEKAFEFEHRDLHWGNLLIKPTDEKFVSVVLDGVEYKLRTKGVTASIIDFTLSRLSHDGCCIFNDLSVDPSLFVSQGDYQFEIYRLMRRAVNDDWSAFNPKTNLYWLHYMLDKMIKLVRYKNTKTQLHKKYIKRLKFFEKNILNCKDSSDFVLTRGVI